MDAKKTLTIKIDAEIAKQFKLTVTANDTTIQNVLTDLIKSYIEQHQSKK